VPDPVQRVLVLVKAVLVGMEHVELSTTEAKRAFARKMVILFNLGCAIIKDGLSPFVSVFLVVSCGWTPSQAGAIWTIREGCTVLAQAPMGDLIDKTKYKKDFLVISSFFSAFCAVMIVYTQDFTILALKSVVEGFAAATIDPGKCHH